MGFDIGVSVTPQGISSPLGGVSRQGNRYRYEPPDARSVVNEVQDTAGEFFDEPDYGSALPDHVEQIGESNWYATPNDPVDPTNCRQWPDSPYCGRNPFDTIPLGAEVEIERNGCVTCVTTTPTVLFIRGPQYTVCRVSDECVAQEKSGLGDIPLDNPLESPPLISEPVAPAEGWCRVLYAGTRKITFNWSTFDEANACFVGLSEFTESEVTMPGVAVGGVFNGPWASDPFIRTSYRSARFTEVRAYKSVCVYVTGQAPQKNPRPSIFYLITFEYIDYEIDGEIPPPPPDSLLIFDSCKDPVRPPPVPPRPRGDDDVCNCEELEDMIAQIYLKVGVPDFPFQVPQTIYGRSDKVSKLKSIPEIFAWLTYQMDALVGEWPVAIEIEDTDPTKKGNQRFRADIPNVAEGIAELFGLAYKTDTQTDILTEMVLRLVSEVISIKNSSIVTQDYVKANASFLGYRGNARRRRVPYSFDPAKLDDFNGLLTSTTKDVVGWVDDDPETVVSYLQHLQFAAGIIKAAFMRPGGEARELLDSIRNIAEEGANGEESWANFLSFLNRDTSPLHRNAPTKPQATEIPLVDPNAPPQQP